MIGRPEISRLSVAGGASEGAQEKDYVLEPRVQRRHALRRCHVPRQDARLTCWTLGNTVSERTQRVVLCKG